MHLYLDLYVIIFMFIMDLWNNTSLLAHLVEGSAKDDVFSNGSLRYVRNLSAWVEGRKLHLSGPIRRQKYCRVVPLRHPAHPNPQPL
jgi:hypothetical protein